MVARPQKRSTDEILAILGASDEKFLWMSEIADRAGYSKGQDVKDKLLKLAAEGYVGYRDENAYIWWITDEGREYLEGID